MMTSLSQHDFVGNGGERSMFVQRPSSGKCQDISHLLTRIFRDEFTKDAIDQDMVRNLTTSKSGKSGYHDQYVDKLDQIQKQWEKRIGDANKIEKHLEEAHSFAREEELVKERKASEDCTSYKDLGLPSVHSHLDYHLNSDMLRQFNLIVPQDFIKDDTRMQYKTEDENMPQYARPTTSSMQRYRKTPIDDNYYPEKTADQKETSRKGHENDAVDILKINHSSMSASVKNAYQSVDKGKTIDSVPEEKNIWRELMKPSQRQLERNDLAQLQQRADYLKNPRFVPPKSIKGSGITEQVTSDNLPQGKTKCNAEDVFVPNPNPIMFTDYEAGKEYEIVLTLKNITTSSRQLRVLPPTSSYFTVSLGRFPTSDGLVAPGMSCQYTIKFTPDSLADFDDEIKVETPFSEPHLIALKARRPPPILSLSKTLSCGHCLVGGTKSVQFSCLNTGGEGRFVIIPKYKWKTGNVQEFHDCNDDVTIGPFIIQPTSFHLNPNDNVNITISFSPKAVKKFQESIIMICDNCQVSEFELEGYGETANIEFLSIEGGLNSYELGESKYELASYLVRFDDQIPGTTNTKKLHVRNITSVELEYYWLIDRPVYKNPSQKMMRIDSHQESSKPKAFEINPSSGKLTALATSSFDLSFNPSKLTEYRNVAKMILIKVPCSNGQESDMSDLVAIQMELKGGTKTFEVTAHPKVLILDGKVEVKVPHETSFQVHNNSSSTCPISWRNIEDEDCIIQVEPNHFQIGPNAKRDCYVTCVGKRPGFTRRIMIGEIPYGPPVFCHFEAHFSGPVVRFTDRVLNFGLVRHLENQKRLVELKNFSSIDVRWKLADSLMEQLSIEPRSGAIDCHGSQVIIVHLKADNPCMLNEIIEIEVESGDNCYLEARAIIERPEVVLLASNVTVDECFANIPVSKAVILQNLTLFSVQYKWTKILGKDSESCSLQFKNGEGTLKPRETLDTEMTFCAKKQGDINDLIAICEIEGMVEPLLLSITAKVSGLMIDFSTPDVSGDKTNDRSQNQLKLEFGYDVPLSLNPKTAFVLENKSAIATSFSISVQHFSGGRVPTPPEKKRPGKTESRSRNLPLLTTTALPVDPFNRMSEKALKDHCVAVLSDGKGAAFLPTPSQGQIGPFEQVIIEVTAYMDMWGEYNDNLICMVDGLEPVKIPIHIECSGCPLNFQFSKDPNPILRFGSHISGGETYSRSLKINNPSPCDIRLDWQSYSAENDDNQLIDLHALIANPFPLLDENGCEIESDDDITEPLIKVKLNPHQGKLSNVPFAIEQKQMIVPAKGSAQATAKFIPLQNARETMQVQGYALGFMSLVSKDKFHEDGKSLRCDGIDVIPFHLNFTGSVKPARVIVEPESEDGFLFETMASSLLQLQQNSIYSVVNESITSRRFVLSNNSGTLLQFSIDLQEPFVLLSFGNEQAASHNGSGFCISQGSNVEIQVGLKLTPSLISSLRRFDQGNEIQNVQNEIKPQEFMKRKETESAMHLTFPNKTKQTYNLKALINLPLLETSSRLLDFQTCLVGQDREFHVVLKNVGKSDCCWTAKLDEDYPETCRSVFKIHPVAGYLEGDVSHGVRNSETIKVTFTARQNVEYECRIIFNGVFEEEPLILRLVGKGSFDQCVKCKDCSCVNVSMLSKIQSDIEEEDETYLKIVEEMSTNNKLSGLRGTSFNMETDSCDLHV